MLHAHFAAQHAVFVAAAFYATIPGMLQLLIISAVLTVVPVTQTAPGPDDNNPIEPFRIADNVYYVGASDIASYLITTPEGHILIDAGYEQTVPLIEASVAKLGFRMRDIRILLNTQAHFDHAAGFARMKDLTGARLMISEPDADVIAHGGHGDFYFGDRATFPAATVDRRLKDGDTVRLGAVTLTAHLTPGHTKGCTTWTFDTRDSAHGGALQHVVVLGGLTMFDDWRVSGMPTYPNIQRDFERTFATLRRLPCDLFLGAHLSYFQGREKAARLSSNAGGVNPFVDPDGFRAFVDRAEQRFRQRLAQEKGAGSSRRDKSVTSRPGS